MVPVYLGIDSTLKVWKQLCPATHVRGDSISLTLTFKYMAVHGICWSWKDLLCIGSVQTNSVHISTYFTGLCGTYTSMPRHITLVLSSLCVGDDLSCGCRNNPYSVKDTDANDLVMYTCIQVLIMSGQRCDCRTMKHSETQQVSPKWRNLSVSLAGSIFNCGVPKRCVLGPALFLPLSIFTSCLSAAVVMQWDNKTANILLLCHTDPPSICGIQHQEGSGRVERSKRSKAAVSFDMMVWRLWHFQHAAAVRR